MYLDSLWTSYYSIYRMQPTKLKDIVLNILFEEKSSLSKFLADVQWISFKKKNKKEKEKRETQPIIFEILETIK